MLAHVAGMKPTNPTAMQPFTKGGYTAVIASTEDDLEAVQKMRGLCFGKSGADMDQFDSINGQVLIRALADNRLVASFRMLPITGETILQSYSAQHYSLDSLTDFKGLMLEIGRFCIHPDEGDPDILRVAWGALTAFVDDCDIKFLFGCSSFAGTVASSYLSAFALLQNRHLAPKRWLPQIKSTEIVKFAANIPQSFDPREAMQQIPPLLRTYLLMGGWVSDHAVVDRQMNTLHVFTGVEVGAIPEARKRLLRASVA